VIAKNADQVTVNHEEIPGLMPAMIMSYQVKDSTGLEQVQPGDSITANLVVDRNNNLWLEHLAITDTSARGSVAATTPTELEPGDQVPDVQFTNQDGRKIHLRDFRGKSVLITFIYTRCPFPTFCPLLSNEFASIQRELLKSPEIYNRTHLVSVTLDPSYDTPPVLREYGLSYLQNDPAGFAHWDFVSTSPTDLRTLATGFGLVYFEKDNQITHSMLTVLLAPDSIVAKVWTGNEWRKSEILDAMRMPQAAPNPLQERYDGSSRTGNNAE
jgi:protein SCO1/2